MGLPKSVLDDLGEEVTGIVAPVAICMTLTVLLVRILNPNGNSDSNAVLIANAYYHEHEGDSSETKLSGSLINALIFVGIITVMTFVIFLLFKYNCTNFIYGYMGFATFVIFFFITGSLVQELMSHLDIHMDAISFFFILYNFSMAGALGLFFWPAPLLMKQGYLVVVGVAVAYIFTNIPPWTTWTLLVFMALYDLFAVLSPIGPLKALVELAMERDEDIPALVYEARAVNRGGAASRSGTHARSSAAVAEGAIEMAERGRGGRPWAASGVAEAEEEEVLDYDLQTAPCPSWTLGAGNRFRPRNLLPAAAGIWYDAAPGAWAHPGTPAPLRATLPPEPAARWPGPVAEARMDSRDAVCFEVQPADAAAAQAVPAADASEQTALLTRQAHSSSSALAAEAGAAGSSQALSADASAEIPSSSRWQGRRRPDSGRAEEEEEEFFLPDSIKLGLGDFIFYSVLVGRAAMFDMMTVFASFLAIIAGLGITLLLLAIAKKALPALPFSIALGLVFYFMTQLVLEPVMVPMTLNLVFF